MPKLNDSRGSHCWFPGWLKELAHWVEVIDPHNFEENRYIRRELVRIAKAILKVEVDESHPCAESAYEPQTYDEAIALCKGWKRAVVDGFVHWENSKGVWAIIDPDDKVGFSFADYECYNVSWERRRWPELMKEMNEGRLHCNTGVWIFDSPCVGFMASTPGRVVCQAYLIYEGHADWAKRLSKND